MMNTDAQQVFKTTHDAMGISYSPSQTHSIQGGVDSFGTPYYTDPSLANNPNPKAGVDHVEAFTQAYKPFGILNDTHMAMLDHVKEVSSNPDLMAKIDKLDTNGADNKEKVEAILGAFNPSIKNVSQIKESQSGLNGALAAMSVANKWSTLSDAQKAIGIANVGIQGIHGFTGNNLNQTEIPGSKSLVDGKGVPVGAATAMFKGGVNAYALGKNWPQIDAVGKIAYGTKNLAQGTQVGAMLGMLGTGTEGSTVNITPEQLSRMGATPSPHMGIGAITLGPGTSVPNGYQLMHSLAGSVAIPTANAHSAAITPSSTLGTVKAVQSIADGTHPVVKNWSNR